MIEATIFGDAINWIKGIATEQALAVVLTLAIGYAIRVFKREIKPKINTRKKKDMALWIAQLADDITDEILYNYPKSKLADKIDKAVDKLQEVIIGIKPEVAKRAVTAAIVRKGEILDD